MNTLQKIPVTVCTGTDSPKLTQIQIIERCSEETPCFSATLEWRGAKYHVSNDGHGGCNRYAPHLPDDTMAALDEWCAQNCPDIPEVINGTMDFETFTFQVAFDFLEWGKLLHRFCRQHGVKCGMPQWNKFAGHSGGYQIEAKDGQHDVIVAKETDGWTLWIVCLPNGEDKAQQRIRYRV